MQEAVQCKVVLNLVASTDGERGLRLSNFECLQEAQRSGQECYWMFKALYPT